MTQKVHKLIKRDLIGGITMKNQNTRKRIASVAAAAVMSVTMMTGAGSIQYLNVANPVISVSASESSVRVTALSIQRLLHTSLTPTTTSGTTESAISRA